MTLAAVDFPERWQRCTRWIIWRDTLDTDTGVVHAVGRYGATACGCTIGSFENGWVRARGLVTCRNCQKALGPN